MTKILVLYYSSYGHTSTMAEAVAEGVREAGAEAVIRHVPETAPDEVVKNAGFTGMPGHEAISGPDELAEYDGIVVGSPTRYGRMTSQMAAFWDTTGGLWMKGALIGKVGAAFTLDGSVSYDFSEDSYIQLNVRNLLDKAPPRVLGSSANVDLYNHDLVGRFATLRLTHRF